MDQILTRLQSLFNLPSALALTVPGMVAAAALAMLLWPPAPADDVPAPTATALMVNGATHTACGFELKQLIPAENLAAEKIKSAAKANQTTLDHALRTINECIAVDENLVAGDSAASAKTQGESKALAADRDSMQAQYAKYARTLNPLASEFLAAVRRDSAAMYGAESSMRTNQANIKAARLRLVLEKQYLAEISARLMDPGRLRPPQAFDDVWTALSNHVMAFLIFSLVIGFALSPVNKFVFGGLFEALFLGWLNRFHKGTRFNVWRGTQ